MMMYTGISASSGFFFSWIVRWCLHYIAEPDLLTTLLPLLYFSKFKQGEDYHRIANKLRTGDVVLASSTGSGGQFINHVSASTFSHVALIVRVCGSQPHLSCCMCVGLSAATGTHRTDSEAILHH